MEASIQGSRVEEVEVSPKAQRRRHSTEYKIRILREADACTKPGELGALLRREGLYSSNLSGWRLARERGELVGLTSRKRGPRAKEVNPLTRKVVELERENRKWKARAERAEALVDLQKKVSEILGIHLPENDEKGS